MGMEPAPATEGAKRLRIVLGDQLLPIELLDGPADTRVFMAEDLELCTRVRHHQQKLVLFLAAMRAYRDALVARGYDVTLVGDAHTTEDLSEWGAPSPALVIAHTNLYWGQQSAPGRTATVVATGDVELTPRG